MRSEADQEVGKETKIDSPERRDHQHQIHGDGEGDAIHARL